MTIKYKLYRHFITWKRERNMGECKLPKKRHITFVSTVLARSLFEEAKNFELFGFARFLLKPTHTYLLFGTIKPAMILALPVISL